MKLIEKKCPNCGAKLSFKDSDKSCKCEFCKTEFEIERENESNKNSAIEDQFNLSELKTPLKIFSIITIGEGLLSFIIFVIALIAIFFIGYNIFKNSGFSFGSGSQYVENVKNLSDDDLYQIDISSKMKVYNKPIGNYSMKGGERLKKIVVASKSNENKIISFYEVTYQDLFSYFNNENTYILYVPVVFNNVKKDVAFSLKDGKVKADKFYFDDSKETYTYGYKSLNEAYDDIVGPLKKSKYKISEKNMD